MRASISQSRFEPAWWLSNAHAQTLWPALFRRRSTLNYNKERLELPDGDFVDLCWTAKRNGAVVAVFHGLEGSIHSPYAGGMMNALDKNDYQAVFMHFRGCSDELNRLPRSYHSGDTADIEFLMQTLRKRYPGSPIFAIAYSLGANALLKYLGEKDRSEQPDAAVAVSVPFLLGNAAKKLEHGLSRIYQAHLISSLKQKTRSKFKHMQAPVCLDNINHLNTFYQFDDQITAPLHGFEDVHDYYKKSSSRQYLKNIKIPTLILHAADDPFMTVDAIPDDDELSKHIQLELSRHGGHVGFISGKYPWSPVYWLEQRIIHFLNNRMSNRKNEGA